MPHISVMVTGHRPNKLFGYKDKAAYDNLCQLLVTALCNHVAPEMKATSIRAISGGAQGADQTFFWAAEAMKTQGVLVTTNDLYLPFPAQASRWAEKGMFGQVQYRAMVEAADAINYTDPHDDLTTRQVFAALLQRNRDMVGTADACIAVHLDSEPDPFDPTTKGGTAHAMRDAAAKGLPIWVVEPVKGEIRKVR